MIQLRNADFGSTLGCQIVKPSLLGTAQYQIRNPHSAIHNRMRVIASIAGIIIAAAGGALVYHALLIEPPRAALVTSTGTIRELPNVLHIVGGIIMLVIGICLAFLSLRRKRS
jgi:cation transporter-like permease